MECPLLLPARGYRLASAPPSGPSASLGPAWAGIQAASPPIPRLVRWVTGAPAPFLRSPPHHKLQEKKRSNYSLVLVGHRFTGRQAYYWRVPGAVGNPAADIVSKINPSTTLFQKFGVLRGFAPKCPFAYFSGMGKVGPRRVGGPHPRQGCRNLHTATTKGGRARGRNPSLSPAAPGASPSAPLRSGPRRHVLHISRTRHKAGARSFRRSASPHRTRCAGLRRGPWSWAVQIPSAAP